MTTDSFTSRDGTRIGYVRLGRGPALVFIHASLCTGEDWIPVASLLSESFTCFVMDRRGRGKSGDSPEYAIEREYEDVAELLQLTGPLANLLGHSYGAVCALGAALTIPLQRLILYEPPLPVGGPVAGPYLADYRNAIAAGDYDRALEIGYTKFVAIPPSRVPSMQKSSEWARARALAPTWVREIQAIEQHGPSLDRYGELDVPTLLLLGSESAQHPLKNPTEALSRVLPNARLSILTGQGHIANLRAPELVAMQIRSFLMEESALAR